MEGTILYTVGHELTHFMHDWNEATYNFIADFLVKKYGNETMEKLIKAKQKQSNAYADYEVAKEEVVAESMQQMLTDTDAGAKIAELCETERGRKAGEKISEYLKRMSKNIKEQYAGQDVSPEARMARKLGDDFGTLADMFARGVAQAAMNYRAANVEGNVKINSKNDVDLKYQARNGETKDAKSLTENDLRNLLEDAQNGLLSKSSYIPLRINTPQFFAEVVNAHASKNIVDASFPMAISVDHLIQNMEEDDGTYNGNHRPHGLDADDIISISKNMNDPIYITLQKNGRYAEIVSFHNNKRNKKVLVSIDFAGSNSNYKRENVMNGYARGYYNIIVTQFEPDNLEQYISCDEIVYDKKKMNGKYQVGSGRVVTVTRDTPFIQEDYSITQNDSQGVSKKNITENSDNVMKQERLPSERDLLVAALEEVTDKKSFDYEILTRYKTQIEEAEKQRQIISDMQEKLFTPSKRGDMTVKEIREEMTKAANRLDTIDKKLLRITSAKPFKRLLERERAKARRTAKSEMRENYDKRTARQKIRSELKSLRKMIREQSKEKNVKQELVKPVEAAEYTVR